jgi:predicted transcriptional regulator
MIKRLEDAIEKVGSLSEGRQKYVARVLEQLVEEGIDAADAGRVVSEAEMDAIWNRHRPWGSSIL